MNPQRLLPTLFGCFSLLLLLFPTVHAGTVENLDRQNGLPDAQIGTPVTAFKGLEQIEETGRWTSYKRTSDKLTFNRFELTSITYNFFKGRLYSVFLEAEGKRNVRGILHALEDLYGRDHTLETRAMPAEKSPGPFPSLSSTPLSLQTREWTGKKVYLLYKNGDNFEGAQITYLDRTTWDTLQVPKQERSAELRKMLQGSFTNGDF